MGEQKSFEASERKRTRARREGNVPRSQLIAPAMVLLVSSFGLLMVGRWVGGEILLVLHRAAESGFSRPEQRVTELLLILLVGGVAPVTAMVVISVMVNAAQVGLHLEPALVLPKGERLNPVAGVGRAIGGLRELPWVIARASLGGAVGGIVVTQSLTPQVDGLFRGELNFTAPIQSGLRAFAVVTLVIGVIDLIMTRKRYFRELSMSHDELRREHREEEGDPHMRSMRRSLHESLALREVVQRVRRSKVIVVERAVGAQVGSRMR